MNYKFKLVIAESLKNSGNQVDVFKLKVFIDSDTKIVI